MRVMGQTLKAEVRNGRLVLDEPTDLPDGTVVELELDPFARLSEDERARLNASIDRGLTQASTGESRPLEEFLAEL